MVGEVGVPSTATSTRKGRKWSNLEESDIYYSFSESVITQDIYSAFGSGAHRLKMGAGGEGKVNQEMKNMEYKMMTSVGCSALDFGVKIQCKPVTHGGMKTEMVKSKDSKLQKLGHRCDSGSGEKFNHGQTTSNIKVYICPTCGNPFTEKKNFAKHKKSVHGENTGAKELEEFCYNVGGTNGTTALRSTGSSLDSFFTAEEE